MRRALIISAIALALAGCNEPTAEEAARARRVLPSGCAIYNVGQYGDLNALVVVTCPAATTTTLYRRPSGKTSVQVAVVSVEGAPQ